MRRSFNFRGRNCEQFGILMNTVHRTLIPQKRKNLIEIPGRDGRTDASLTENYSNVVLTVECGYKATSQQTVRTMARDIAGWLSRKGELEFTDEPGKYYDAQVISEIPLETCLRIGRFTIEFDCFPFAMSRPNVREFDITQTEQMNPIQVSGTANTPVILMLKNIGDTPITNIRFGHKVDVT